MTGKSVKADFRILYILFLIFFCTQILGLKSHSNPVNRMLRKYNVLILSTKITTKLIFNGLYITVQPHISQHHISQQILTFRNTFWTLKICEMWSENSLTFRNTSLTLRISEMWSVPELRIENFQNIRNTSIPILYNSIPIRAPVQYLI